MDEEELKKKGFNPEGLEIEEVRESEFFNYDKDFQEFITPTPEEAQQLVSAFKYAPPKQIFPQRRGTSPRTRLLQGRQDLRGQVAGQQDPLHRQGNDQNSGQEDHQRRSQPHQDLLPHQGHGPQDCPRQLHHLLLHEPLLHETRSGSQGSPRTHEVRHHQHHLRLLLHLHVREASNPAATQLNPVIGETLQASFADGTQVYCEQVSHHPPISYFLAVGPEGGYRYYGCYNFSAHAGLNSMELVNKGHRVY